VLGYPVRQSDNKSANIPNTQKQINSFFYKKIYPAQKSTPKTTKIQEKTALTNEKYRDVSCAVRIK